MQKMKQQQMNKNNMQKLRRTLGLFSLVILAASAQAQSMKVETVKMNFESDSKPGTEDYLMKLDEDVELIEAAAQHPKTANDPKMWYYKGLTYLTIYLNGSDAQKAKYPDALETATTCFFKSIDTDVKDKYTADAKRSLLNCAIGHYNNGVAYYRDKEYKKAIKSYQTVLDIIPLDANGDLKRNNIVSETLMQYMSYAAEADENYTLAKSLLQKLIDKNFADPAIYVEMVRIYLLEKDTANALKYVAIGREMFESNTTLIDVELDLYLKQGRSEELLKKLDDAIVKDPENKIYYFARGVTNMKLNKPNKAEVDYKKVIELDPSFADAYYNLGVVYVDQTKLLIEESNNTTDYKKQKEYDVKIDDWYKKAAAQFEEALALGEYSNAEKLELATTLKKIYGRLMQNDKTFESKYNSTKALIATLE
ncbi:MAG: tetratricopeptide repeat protein [Bacteroidetes bacterium]|nr:tetratricopeptide repeat protein [Bacteroidota bacterium]